MQRYGPPYLCCERSKLCLNLDHSMSPSDLETEGYIYGGFETACLRTLSPGARDFCGMVGGECVVN